MFNINKAVLWLKFVMFTGHTPSYFNLFFSSIVNMDLEESINLSFCKIIPHGVCIGIVGRTEHYLISEKENGIIAVVMVNREESGLILEEPIKIYHQGKYCNGFGWAWIVIAAHNELLKQNFYANRDKELSFNVVKLT